MGNRKTLKIKFVDFEKNNVNTVFQGSLFNNDNKKVKGISIGNSY